jgi:penicillin amidase
MQAYADGVNTFLDLHKGKYPVEFDILGYEPERWTIRHTLIVAQMMAWELNLSWWTDLTLGAVAERVGLEKALDVFPTYPEDVQPTIVGRGTRQIALAGEGILETSLNYRRFFGFKGAGSGSNAWVVAPEKSASGSVILANDPHLHLQLPSKWYEIHLRAPGYEVGGMSIPGVPGVVIGRNREIAWGLTNLMADESDFYVERLDSADSTKYWYDGRWLPLKSRVEEIRVKEASSVEMVVRSTHHGPVVSDIRTPLQKASPAYVATMRWTGAEPTDRVRAFNKINKARNWGEFLEGVKDFAGPGQNFVYGDREGNIGYVPGVRIPVRGKLNSTLPLPGWDKSSEWKGYVPFEALPRVFNPPEGFVASANNRVAGKEFPYHISDIWEPPSRIQRIRDVLSRTDRFSVTDFERLQNDRFSVFAMEITPHILALLSEEPDESPLAARAVEYLKNWNFEFAADDIATAIFQQMFVRLLHNIYADEMGEDLLHDFVILGSIPIRVTHRLIANGGSSWFDDVGTPEVETIGDIVRRSFSEAVTALEGQFGHDTKDWRWGTMHTVTLSHPFGLVKPLDRVFNVGPFPMGGGSTAIMSGEYDFNEPFAVTVAASFRMVFDFASPGEVRAILPSGQCGQVFHDHYADQTALWLNGAYRTVKTDSASVASRFPDHLVLQAAP